jgi:fructosamine-3-kinase
LVSILITPLHHAAAQYLATSLVNLFAEQRIGWQLELAAEKGIAFGNIDAIVEHVSNVSLLISRSRLSCTAICGPNCALGPDGPYIFDPACYWGDRECDLAMLPLHPISRRKFMTVTSLFSHYRWTFLTGSQSTSFIRC